MDLNALAANYTPGTTTQSSPQPQKKKPGGLKGLLAAALPTIGGTVGSVLGGIAGTVAAPVAGTAAGGIAGGAAGSGLGKFLSQKLTGEDTNWGDIGKEAALGAVPGAAGAAAKGLKGAVAVSKGTKAGEIATETAQGAKTSEQLMMSQKPTIKQRIGQRLTEQGSGLKADKNTGGMAKLDDQSQFMAKYTGTPRQQRVAMETDMSNLSKQVDDILAQRNVPVQGTSVAQRLRTTLDDPNTFPDLDVTSPRTQQLLEKNMQILSSKKDAKSLNDYVKTLNNTATSARDKLADPAGRALTPNEVAALATKRVVDDELKTIPEIADIKKNMAQIFEVTPQVAKAGEKAIGLPFMSGANVKAPVQALKGVQSKVGAKLQGVDTPPGTPPSQAGVSTPGTYAPYLKAGAGQVASRALVSPFLSSSQEDQTTQQTSVMEGQPPVVPSELETPQSDSPFSDPQAIQQAYLSALQAGDSETANLLIKGYELFGQSAGGNQKPLSAEASKVIANANSGLTSLSQLENIINEQSGVSKGTLVPGRTLFGGAGANLLGTGEYDTAARNLTDVITRLRTGAALTDQEASFYQAQIPQAFDSPETRQQKLSLFRDLFQSVANRTGSAGTDSQAALGI